MRAAVRLAAIGLGTTALLLLVAGAARSEPAAGPDTTSAPSGAGLRGLARTRPVPSFELDRSFVPPSRRIALSPAAGRLGGDALYTLRLAFHPGTHLGWEISLAHTPGRSAHAAVHMLSAQLRPRLPGRVQPYASGGYGMAMVFPGRALNASPVTRNAFGLGGGIELFARADVALRGEGRWIAILGDARDGRGAVRFDYGEVTLGFSLNRPLKS